MTQPPPPQGTETVTGQFAGADLPPGTLLAERFRIESIIGMGGMGVVYRATDEALGIQVAVKLLRPELAHRLEAAERFRQELLLARQVSSPHVVRIHDLAQHGNRWLITMDLVEGESLESLIDRNGALPVEQALQITRQLAVGLAAAHARGVIHRDLKPSNILIDQDGNASITDFGVARSLREGGLTQEGAIVGTPDYLAPEQVKGSPMDARSDLYALGLILHEMLTGQQAYAGTTQAESLTQRLVRQPKPASSVRKEVPDWVQRLLNRLLQPRPAHRFADAEAVVRAIDLRKVPLDLRPGRRAAMAVAALVVIAGIAWFLSRSPSAPGVMTPDQIVVLATPAPAELEAPWTAAVEHLRQAMTELPDISVVDGDRTAQAVAQLGLADGDRVDPQAVLELVPARRSLFLSLAAEQGNYKFSGDFGDGDQSQTITGPAAASIVQAARQFGATLAPELQARSLVADEILPNGDESLAAYGEALLARRAGRFEEALAPLDTAVERQPGYPAAWLAQAEAALLTGRYELAYDASQEGLALAAPPGLQRGLETVSALVDGEYDGVAASLREQLEREPDDLGSLLRLGQILGESGDYEGASVALQQLLERDPEEARALYLLGKYNILKGDARSAVDDYLLRALVLHKRGRNTYGEAETANALGIGYSRLGQTADAEEQYRRALELRRTLNDRRGMAVTLRNLAQIETFRGESAAAEALLTEAGGLYEELGDQTGLAAIDRQLGLIAEERGDYESALDAYRRVLRSLEGMGDTHDRAESLNDIGFAHYQLGDYDSAQVFWLQAGEAFARLDDPRGAVRARQNLGLLYIMRGRWSEARDLLETSLAESEERQLAEEAAVSRRNLAELEIVQGHLDAAFSQVERAELLFRELEDQRGLIDAALLRAQAMVAVGASEQAAEALDGVEELLELASGEHQAIAALVQAELALLVRPQAANRMIEAAQRAAVASGITALQLKARILGEVTPEETLAALRSLSNVPLQLRWYQATLLRQVESGEHAAAAASYRAVAVMLRDLGDYVGAFTLHRLGALALAASGDTPAAAEARSAADQALERLLSSVSEPLREVIESDPVVVAFQDDANGG